MPTKVETETQLARLLGNSPLQVDLELIHTATHKSKNVDSDHLLSFYKTFDEIKHRKFDGMIITGAPVEHLEFEEVEYWDELCEIRPLLPLRHQKVPPGEQIFRHLQAHSGLQAFYAFQRF